MDIFKRRGTRVRKNKVEDKQDGQLSTISTISSKLKTKVKEEVQLVGKKSKVAGTRKREQIRLEGQEKGLRRVGYKDENKKKLPYELHTMGCLGQVNVTWQEA